MIAVAYDNIVGLNAIPPEQGWNLVREWAEKALRIDKNNSDAYMLMGDVKFSLDWDWPGAEANYKKAIQLNPNNFIAYNWYGTFLSSMGRNSEALAMSKKALELGPLSIEPYYNGVYIRMDNRQMKQAEDLMRKAKELFPHHPLGLGIHGMLLMRESKYREALRLFEAQLHGELSPGMKIRAKSRMGFALAQIGEEQKAREILENLFKISKVSNVSPYKIALIYLALNETDKTFTWLERAYNERCDDLVKELKTSPFLDKIRPDPRFQDLLKRMKLDQ
jgi:tetratricopeptide (TPR) repeat protein